MEDLVPTCIDLKRRNIGRNGHSIKILLLSQTVFAIVSTLRESSSIIQLMKFINALTKNSRSLKGCMEEKFKKGFVIML